MTMKRSAELSCPKCSTKIPVTIYDTLNITIEGEDMKEKLLSGDLFDYKCPKCGHPIQLEFPMLYHDMKQHLKIWIVPKGCDGEQKRIDEITALKVRPGYTTRLVASSEELREKIRIFDQNLDDRVIEICKPYLWGDFLESDPKYEKYEMINGQYVYMGAHGYDGTIMYYYEHDGKRDTIALSLDNDYYKMIKDAFAEEINELGLNNYDVINENYAWDAIELRRKNKNQ